MRRAVLQNCPSVEIAFGTTHRHKVLPHKGGPCSGTKKVTLLPANSNAQLPGLANHTPGP